MSDIPESGEKVEAPQKVAAAEPAGFQESRNERVKTPQAGDQALSQAGLKSADNLGATGTDIWKNQTSPDLKKEASNIASFSVPLNKIRENAKIA